MNNKKTQLSIFFSGDLIDRLTFLCLVADKGKKNIEKSM